jgi:hypothetical protein
MQAAFPSPKSRRHIGQPLAATQACGAHFFAGDMDALRAIRVELPDATSVFCAARDLQFPLVNVKQNRCRNQRQASYDDYGNERGAHEVFSSSTAI